MDIIVVALTRYYISRTWAFLALSDLERNLLTFVKAGVAIGLDFRVVYEQIIAATIGSDKSKALTITKPFYHTYTHYHTPLAL